MFGLPLCDDCMKEQRSIAGEGSRLTWSAEVTLPVGCAAKFNRMPGGDVWPCDAVMTASRAANEVARSGKELRGFIIRLHDEAPHDEMLSEDLRHDLQA